MTAPAAAPKRPAFGAQGGAFGVQPIDQTLLQDTPQSLERKRRLAEAMLKEGSSYSPIQSWTQGMARVANSVMGGLESGWADKREADGRAQSWKEIMGGGQAPGASPGGDGAGATDDGRQSHLIPADKDTSWQTTIASPQDAADAGGHPHSPGFVRSMAQVFGFEGGRLAADTNGTPSLYGMNKAAHPEFDTEHGTRAQAAAIYKRDYWDKINADSLPPELQTIAFDTAVMSGPGRAQQFIKESGGDPYKFMQLRTAFLGGLLKSNPEKYGRFANAWHDRNATLMAGLQQPGDQPAVADAGGAAPQEAAAQPNAMPGATPVVSRTVPAAIQEDRMPPAVPGSMASTTTPGGGPTPIVPGSAGTPPVPGAPTAANLSPSVASDAPVPGTPTTPGTTPAPTADVPAGAVSATPATAGAPVPSAPPPALVAAVAANGATTPGDGAQAALTPGQATVAPAIVPQAPGAAGSPAANAPGADGPAPVQAPSAPAPAPVPSPAAGRVAQAQAGPQPALDLPPMPDISKPGPTMMDVVRSDPRAAAIMHGIINPFASPEAIKLGVDQINSMVQQQSPEYKMKLWKEIVEGKKAALDAQKVLGDIHAQPGQEALVSAQTDQSRATTQKTQEDIKTAPYERAHIAAQTNQEKAATNEAIERTKGFAGQRDLTAAQADEIRARIADLPNTPAIKEYKFDAQHKLDNGIEPQGFSEWQIAVEQAKANKVAINTESQESIETSKGRIGELNKLADDFEEAVKFNAHVGMLDTLIHAGNMPQGAKGYWSDIAGRWGLPVKGVDEVQAFNSILDVLTPGAREGLPGSASNLDVQMFKGAFPKLINQPGGNELIMQGLKSMIAYRQQADRIGRDFRAGRIDTKTAYDKLDALSDPLDIFKEKVAKLGIIPGADQEPAGPEGDDAPPPGVDDETRRLWKHIRPEDRKAFYPKSPEGVE